MHMGKLLDRINELSRKQNSVGLTDEELTERDELRKKYLAQFRRNFKDQLDNIKWADEEEDTTKH
ncbi:hypothetical protein BG53_13880 [Paenibacillus darwinianus]|uniref:UPF0291 protein BG53_13880 n=2 Tax=Paenibacillus darwinianus TaxID=1380763 RepID=A0A9W5S1N2_9BACL|nr:hypothetical protein BG52_14670 [Paenibacillus darwinianus]EXX90204.1 hypothetical protein BG53_13880 [Paenibacillus darwinianus]EXX90626.1 hypothetical protein CH50_15010 [Paenibacillus darwinianus]